MKRYGFGGRVGRLVVATLVLALCAGTLLSLKAAHGRGLQSAQGSATSASDSQSAALQHDGSHDFDFLIGDWHAHVRRLPDRLVHSNNWIEYDGISNHHKIFDTSANLEEFDVTSTDKKLRIKAQTLRMYNPGDRISGAFTDWSWTRGAWRLRRWWGSSTAIAASSTISSFGRAGWLRCVISGGPLEQMGRTWIRRFRQMAEKRGK